MNNFFGRLTPGPIEAGINMAARWTGWMHGIWFLGLRWPQKALAVPENCVKSSTTADSASGAYMQCRCLVFSLEKRN